jgi:hypothetical protein
LSVKDKVVDALQSTDGLIALFRLNGVFGDGPKAEAEPAIDVKTLHAKIGELALENDFCPARSARRVCC